MPRISDPAVVRAGLRQDPAWAAYALCDLSLDVWPKTQWFGPDLTLVLHDYGTCILFAMGTGSLAEALTAVTWPCHIQVQQEAFDWLASGLTISHDREMWRMLKAEEPKAAVGAFSQVVRRLEPADVPALQALYADGEASGEAPDFFMPQTVNDGAYCGVFEGQELVAAAGTHVLSRDEGAAAIGNVYTRRDRRGRGLARAGTAGVLERLDGVATVALNVRTDNAVALRVYESLGFRRHCRFHEAVAHGPLC